MEKQELQKRKLTIDQLKNYLGTGLKIMIWPWYKDHYPELSGRHLEEYETGDEIRNIKPICYRLSDLDNFIPELGFVPIDEMFGGLAPTKSRQEKCKDMMRWPLIMPFSQVKQLFQWHFWPFDQSVFDEGLVIDKLTHGKEVSHES